MSPAGVIESTRELRKKIGESGRAQDAIGQARESNGPCYLGKKRGRNMKHKPQRREKKLYPKMDVDFRENANKRLAR